MKVLFWDIDGTLINNDRAGMYAWVQALEEEHGAPVDVSDLRVAGMTDAGIGRIAIEQTLGRPYDEGLARQLLDRYVELLPEWLERRSAGRVLPSVREILAAVEARPDIDQALLTGNLAAGARLKLGHYGLWDFFSWGSYADTLPNRRDIAREARRMARERHEQIDGVWVIGDTEHDIDCGHAIDAHTIALGTGPFTAEELAAHDPWWAIDELPAANEFLARIDDA
jgi:phosphoglycolate phosphatase-like HAD superfamily hydrolase